MLRHVVVFNSHPVQHYAPWWQEVARQPGLRLKVFYYSRANVQPSYDRQFQLKRAYDIDLLGGYEHAFLPRRWPFRDPTSTRWYALNRGIREAVREAPWDAALVFGYNLLNNWAVVRHCRRAGVPIVFCSDSNGRTALERPAWKRGLKQLVVRSFFRRVDLFLTPGSCNREYLRLYGVPEERMRRCPLPVDVKRFRAAAGEQGPEARVALRKRFGLEPDDFVITFSGKLMEGKRPQDLADAVRGLGDPKIKALFVGSGAMEDEVRRRGGEFVRMAGFINQQEIPRVLAAGDVAVLPSSIENYGLAVVESLALGVPVLGSDRIGCYGPDDALRDGENGFVYPTGDVAALAGLIARLKAEPALRQRLSRRAAELADGESSQAACAAVVSAVEELAARKAGRERTGCGPGPGR